MSAHDFHHLHPTVRPSRCPRSFDYFGDVSERSVEAECVVSTGEIFVDGFGNADDFDTFLRESRSDAESVFTAARHESIEFQSFVVLNYFLCAIR